MVSLLLTPLESIESGKSTAGEGRGSVNCVGEAKGALGKAAGAGFLRMAVSGPLVTSDSLGAYV